MDARTRRTASAMYLGDGLRHLCKLGGRHFLPFVEIVLLQHRVRIADLALLLGQDVARLDLVTVLVQASRGRNR